MTLGDLVLVNAFIQLYIPSTSSACCTAEIRQALTDIERMFGLMGTHREVPTPPTRQPSPAAPADVRFEHVGFAYDPARPSSTTWISPSRPGATVAVVGHSGSANPPSPGCCSLLRRAGGAVRINGQDIRELTQDSLRAAIGIVPQDTVLFNDTLFYNIQYGRPTPAATRSRPPPAPPSSKTSSRRLPDGWQTRVGERGLKLSGGEKQRVAIARTLLKNPDILIFDEATSALDSKTEKAIQAQLDAAARGRTTLVIAHRLSTVMNADEIIVLDQGCIIERGHPHRAAQPRAAPTPGVTW